MPPKRVCSDKEPLGKNKVRENPGICFKKGLRAGFAAGLQRAQKQAEQAMIQRENAMMAVNDVNIAAPRVPMAPTAPVLINIKNWIDGRGGRPVGVKNRSDLLAELVQNERLPNVPTGLSNIKKLGKARMIQLLLNTGRYDRGGER